MKKNITLLLICILVQTGIIKSQMQSLSVSENNRYFQTSDGKPFLYLGDTAWELFHKLTREEATEYLKNRADKGFTVIQAVVLAELNGIHKGNAYGNKPLIDSNPTKPNEKYFEHVDFIVNKAEELGLYIGMLPTWGDKVTDEHGGAGPVIFNRDNAKIFGEFLGKRYKNKPIIWILGGDRLVTNPKIFEVWNAMAQGIEKGNDGKHLISYHPRGGTSSHCWFHNQDWLDFNMYQSGHAKKYNTVYDYAEMLLALQPAKPFIDGEPAYEDISVKFWDYVNWSDPKKVPEKVLDADGLVKDPSHFKEGFFTAQDVRIHAYWNFLSGACGYTYGNNAVWQMFRKGDDIIIPCLTDWRTALDRPGATSMKYVRALFESRPFDKLVPDQSIIYGVNPDGENHIRAAGSTDHSYLIVYLSNGQDVKINMKKISGEKVIAWWYNPATGETTQVGEFKNKGIQQFSSPEKGKDRVLVLDDKSKNYPNPGTWKK